MKKSIISLLLVFVSFNTMAFDWSGCSKEIEEAKKLEAEGKMPAGVKCKDGKTDEEIWECVEKMPGGDEARGDKCQKAHAKYESSPAHKK